MVVSRAIYKTLDSSKGKGRSLSVGKIDNAL